MPPTYRGASAPACEHFTFVINGAPQEHLLLADRHDHLVQMPTARGRRPEKSKIARKHLSELPCPAADRLIAYVNVALRHQVLDVAEAQGEPKIQPNSSADYLRRVPVAGVGDWFHGQKVSKARCQRHSSPITQSYPTTSGVNLTILFVG